MDSHAFGPSRDAPRSEAGFGLVEIVVSMFILGLLSLALLPLLIQGVRISAMNATVASATQLVHDRIEHARAQATCDGVIALQGTTTTTVGSRGKQFDVVVDVDDVCPVSYPGVLRFEVRVADHVVPAEALSEATTLVLVESEN